MRRLRTRGPDQAGRGDRQRELANASLGVAVPAAALLLWLLVTAVGLWGSWQSQLDGLERGAERELRADLQRLTQHADNQASGQLAVDLMQDIATLTSEPMVQVVAVIDPGGVIQLAHRRSWKDLRAAAHLPGWSEARLQLALSRHEVDLRWDANRLQVDGLLAYRVPVFELDGPRQLREALVYVRLDLSAARDAIGLTVLRQRLPDLLGVGLMLAVLAWWLRKAVSSPLESLAATSQRWAAGDLHARAPTHGAPEITRLAQAFNRMAADLQHGQAALRDSEQNLSTILYSTGDALFVTDARLRITLLNPLAEALTGWTESQARGQPVTEVLRVEDADNGLPVTLALESVLSQGQPMELTRRSVMVSLHGQRTPIADRAAPVRDADGTVTGLVLLVRDVTAARELEQALADSELHHRTLANAGQTLIWTTNRRGQPNWGNDPWRRFCGLALSDDGAPEQLHWLNLVHPEDLERAQLDWRRCVDGGEAMRLVLRLRRHDGVHRWMTLDAVPRIDPRGVRMGHVLLAVDTSHEHEAEARLRAQLEELQRWQSAMLGREERVAELKAEVNALLGERAQTPRYPSAAVTDDASTLTSEREGRA